MEGTQPDRQRVFAGWPRRAKADPRDHFVAGREIVGQQMVLVVRSENEFDDPWVRPARSRLRVLDLPASLRFRSEKEDGTEPLPLVRGTAIDQLGRSHCGSVRREETDLEASLVVSNRRVPSEAGDR